MPAKAATAAPPPHHGEQAREGREGRDRAEDGVNESTGGFSGGSAMQTRPRVSGVEAVLAVGCRPEVGETPGWRRVGRKTLELQTRRLVGPGQRRCPVLGGRSSPSPAQGLRI